MEGIFFLFDLVRFGTKHRRVYVDVRGGLNPHINLSYHLSEIFQDCCL